MPSESVKHREFYLTLQGWLFVSPHAVVFCLFTAFPVIFALIVSLHKWNLVLPMQFTGLENYLTAFQDPEFWHSMKVTTIYVVGTVPTTIALALIVAVLLNRQFIGQSYCRMMIYLPVVTSTVSVAIIWMYLFEPTENGLVNRMLATWGVDKQTWLADPDLAMPVLIVLGIWKNLGFSTVILLAGLQGVSRMYYEAAEIDGTSKLRQFWNITVPLVSPTTFFLFILNTINSFKVFGPVFVMTRSGPFDPQAGQNATNVIAYNIYLNAFKYLRMGYASSLACIFLIVILLLTILNFRYGERKVHYQ